MKLSVRLYTSAEQPKTDFPSVLRALAKIGYDGVEFAGLHGHSPDEVRKVLDGAGIVCFDRSRSGVRSDQVGRSREGRGRAGYRPCRPLHWPRAGSSREAVRAAARKINRAIDHFVSPSDSPPTAIPGGAATRPTRAICSSRSAPWPIPSSTSLGHVGGPNPAAYIRRYKGRVNLVHIKDGPLDRDKAMTAVGKGNVDIKAVVGASLKTGVEWGIVELDVRHRHAHEPQKESAKFLKPLFTR